MLSSSLMSVLSTCLLCIKVLPYCWLFPRFLFKFCFLVTLIHPTETGVGGLWLTVRYVPYYSKGATETGCSLVFGGLARRLFNN